MKEIVLSGIHFIGLLVLFMSIIYLIKEGFILFRAITTQKRVGGYKYKGLIVMLAFSYILAYIFT